MRIIDIGISFLTTSLLVANQVLLKLWLHKFGNQILPLKQINVWIFLKPELVFSIISFLIAVILWLGLLKRLDFSLLYPLISIGYVFGLLAARFVFHEEIPFIRWLGVGVILIGVFLISRNP